MVYMGLLGVRKLPEGTEQLILSLVGGLNGLSDTIRLREALLGDAFARWLEVNQHFRPMAEDVARRCPSLGKGRGQDAPVRWEPGDTLGSLEIGDPGGRTWQAGPDHRCAGPCLGLQKGSHDCEV